jgi:putative membrane protein
MSRSLFFAASAALALSACAASDTTAGMTGDLTPTERSAYVQMAAASDMFEIQSSQLAQSKAQRAEVRDFANMMIQHHSQTTQQLTTAATASGTPPSPQLMPMQVEMMDRLQGASGANFDRLYMGQQVQAHEMALALHSNYASNGDTPALRAVASAATPIIRQHLDRARQLD